MMELLVDKISMGNVQILIKAPKTARVLIFQREEEKGSRYVIRLSESFQFGSYRSWFIPFTRQRFFDRVYNDV